MHFGFPGDAGRSSRARSLSSVQRSRLRTLQLDELESRCLLSVTPVGESIFVGDPSPHPFEDDSAQVEVAADGSFVVAWQQAIPGSSYDIRARRFDASGNPLGDFFVVNTFTAGHQVNPTLAMNDDGRFVIAWQSGGQDGSGDGVFAQVYDVNGAPVGGEFAVNTTTAGDQEFPSAAMDDAGNMVISWNGNQFRRFDSGGAALSGEVDAGALFGEKSAVAFDGAGNFIVAGAEFGKLSYRQYNSNGMPIKSTPSSFNYAVEGASIDSGKRTRIAMNTGGDFVIGVSGPGILLQRFDRTGEPQGELKRLPSESLDVSRDFGLVLDVAGNYAVAAIIFDDYLTGGAFELFAFDSDGTPQPVVEIAAGESPVDSAALAMNHNGRLIAIWNQAPGDVQLLAQRLQVDSLRATGLHTEQHEDVVAGEPLPLPVTQLSVSFSLPVSTDGGASGIYSATNPTNWQLWCGSANVSNLIMDISYADGRATIQFAAPLITGDYRLIASDAIQDLQGNSLDGNEDGSAGGAAELPFTIGAVYPTTDPIAPHNGVSRISVAANANGSFVAVWQRAGRLYGQVYTATGLPVGARSTLATVSASVGANAPLLQVGMDGAGNYYVLWRGGSSTSSTLFSYDSTGVPLRSPMQLSVSASQLAVAPDGRVGILSSGSVQLYDANGSTLGTSLTLGVDLSSVFGFTFLPNGDLAAAGSRSYHQNSVSSYHVFVRRFDASGASLGDAQTVAVLPAFDASAAMVAANPAGGFVIGWQQRTTIPGTDPVRYQRDINTRVYDENGQSLSDTIKVNTEEISSTAAENPNLPPVVAFDSAGHFVVSWQNLGVDDSRLGVAARGFFVDGSPLGAPFRINSPQYGDQYAPSIAADASGNILFGWRTWEENGRLQYYRIFELPKLDLNGAGFGVDFDAEATTNGAAVSIAAPTLTIDDAGYSATGARVRIKAPLEGDQLLVNTSGTSITAEYADGVLTLVGDDSRAHYEQVLRTVQFQTSATRPPIAAIEIEFVVEFGAVSSTLATARVVNYVPGAASILNRFLFYNASNFDGWNLAINASDINALANDKIAYLPGSGPATFASVSSYSKGINGIILEISTGHGGLSLADFTFRVGGTNSPNTWEAAPPVSGFTITSARAGVDRITITWPDEAIRNVWLEVTVGANSRTGLAAPDVFYFGNRIGDSGANTTANAFVTSTADAAKVFGALRFSTARTDPHDYNRDRQVTSEDAAIAFANLGSLVLLDLPGPAQTLTAAPQVTASPFSAVPIATLPPAPVRLGLAEAIVWTSPRIAATDAVVTPASTSRSTTGTDEILPLCGKSVAVAILEEAIFGDAEDEAQETRAVADAWLEARFTS